MTMPTFPEVRVAAVAITRGDEFLTTFNGRWGGFTLPMSKRRTWSDPQVPGSERHEEAGDAAIRASAEALGRPLGPDDRLERLELMELEPYHQSNRDGAWKSYRFEVFRLRLAADTRPSVAPGAIFAWLSLDAMRESRPVSPTAIRLAEAIRGAAVLRGEV